MLEHLAHMNIQKLIHGKLNISIIHEAKLLGNLLMMFFLNHFTTL